MWALRRVSVNSVKVQGLNLATLRTCAGLGPFNGHTEDKSSDSECHCSTLSRWITSSAHKCTHYFPHKLSVGSRSLSSQAGAKSGGEEDNDLGEELGEGFSDLETTAGGGKDGDDSSESDSDFSNVNENVEEGIDGELMKDEEGDAEKKLSRKRATSLLKILDDSGPSLSKTLDSYFAEGNELSRTVVYDTLAQLRRKRRYLKALQLFEWLEKREVFEFSEKDYASMLDLIAKVRGLWKAENYIDTIPTPYRQEIVYRTLLANCVSNSTNVAKAEEIFNRMKGLGLPLSSFTCNQLLLLYRRTDKKKIADVLLLMEKEDIKPSSFTYQLLIDTKGQVNDIVGMERVLETMQAEGVDPSSGILASLARNYVNCGFKEKAEEVLKKMEGDDLNSNREVCPVLLRVYASLGKADDVERVWKFCESNPRHGEYLAAIEAWGKLKNIQESEAVFKKMIKSANKITEIHYCTMLKVYVENKMLSEGKELIKQMGESGCFIGPIAWDALVMLYVGAGQVEKADSMLQKATEKNPLKKPLFNSYMALLDQYGRKGDVHNAEKIFQKLKDHGYVSRARPYTALLQAYIKAKVPAYGFRERMKADQVFPSKQIAGQLALLDAFKKNAATELLD